jgi:EAL domain-containing protein (putative c-di-GMP-specific phosphodiesterase class I)
MATNKLLWTGVICVLTLVFGIALILNTLSTRDRLEQALGAKNAEVATALAQALSQQAGNPAGLEQTLVNQFNSGAYEILELTDPQGKPIVYRVSSNESGSAPAWFSGLLPLRIAPGTAPVLNGEAPLGTLQVESDTGLAHQALWRNAQQLLVMLIVAVVLVGLLGNYLLKRLMSPLEVVVEQARAIGEKRFVEVPEPEVPELRDVTRSMNTLAAQTKKMLQQESKRLEKMSVDALNDKVSGLLNREPFVKTVQDTLQAEDLHGPGALGMIRVRGLSQLNQIYGRKAIDALLKDMGGALNRLMVRESKWTAARMNGSDFAVLAPGAEQPDEVAREIQNAFREVLDNHSMPEEIRLPGAATDFHRGDSVGELLTRLDGALLAVDREGGSSITVARKGDIDMKPVREQMLEWRKLFDTAFRKQLFSTRQYPVLDRDGQLLHNEAQIHLEWQDQSIDAERIKPWVNRLEMSNELDQRLVDLALDRIQSDGQPVCVGLSAQSVTQRAFLSWITERLSTHATLADKLWLDVPEATVFQHTSQFQKLRNRVGDHGCQIGIGHGGHRLVEMGQLQGTGLDYLKVDSSFTRGIDTNEVNQTLFHTLIRVGKALKIKVIAEGVETEKERAALLELGADGFSGPAANRVSG